MFDIDHEKYLEGHRAYGAGMTLRGLADMSRVAYEAAEAAAKQTEFGTNPPYGSTFREAEKSTNSFVLGFADGVLSDFRRMAGRGGTRA